MACWVCNSGPGMRMHAGLAQVRVFRDCLTHTSMAAGAMAVIAMAVWLADVHLHTHLLNWPRREPSTAKTTLNGQGFRT